MNIATFGCSFTSGLKREGGYNWVNFYAKKYPQHTFYNLAYPGSSLAFQIFLMKELKKRVQIDKVIFQITTPFRFTYFNDYKNFDILNLETSDNVKFISLEYNDNIDAIHPGLLYPSIWQNSIAQRKELRIRKFAEDYVSRASRSSEVETVEYSVLTQWLAPQVDFIFFHREPSRFIEERTGQKRKPIPEVDNIICLEKEINSGKFIDFAIDNQFHFSEEGARWEADWVDSKFKLD